MTTNLYSLLPPDLVKQRRLKLSQRFTTKRKKAKYMRMYALAVEEDKYPVLNLITSSK